jgi:hypothetical protein
MSKMTIAEWCLKAAAVAPGHMRCAGVSCSECPFYHNGLTDGTRSCGDGEKFNGDFPNGCQDSSEYLFRKYRISAKLDLI